MSGNSALYQRRNSIIESVAEGGVIIFSFCYLNFVPLCSWFAQVEAGVYFYEWYNSWRGQRSLLDLISNRFFSPVKNAPLN